MRTLGQDLKYAFRTLEKSPAFTAAAVICLMLGIGATTAIFSVVNAVILQPLPYRNSDRLVRIYTEFPQFPNGGLRKFAVSMPEYLDLRRDIRSLESLDTWSTTGVNLTGGGTEPLRVTASFVSGDLLKNLGVSPVLGRVHTAQDDRDGAPLTAVISYGLWQRAFGGDRDVAGRGVTVNGRGATVIGVMPRVFRFPAADTDPTEIWLPLQINPANPGGRGSHNFAMVGRLRNGVTIEQLRADLASYVNAMGPAAPNTHTFNSKFHTLITDGLQEDVVGSVRPALLALFGAVCFVLLIASVNVANLLLARAESRQREIAVRKAIGAGSMRLLRQFMTEGVLLTTLSGILGAGFAWLCLKILVTMSAATLPRVAEISLSIPVLLFTLGVSVLTGLIFGLAPMIPFAAGTLHDGLKAGAGRTTAGSGSHYFRGALVVTELALALVLLIGTGLMLHAFWRLQQVNVGVDAEKVMTMRVSLPAALYQNGTPLIQFWQRFQERVAHVPGVESVSYASGLPPARPINANDTQIEGFVPRQGGPIQNVDYWQAVGPRFFETMRIPLVEGRYLDERDGADAPGAVVVNQTMGRTFWPGESPLGHRLKADFKGPWLTVVGVIADVKNAGVDKPTGCELFFTDRQAQGVRTAYLFIRTKGQPEDVVSAVRAELASIDRSLPLAAVRTMEDVVGAAQSRPRFLTLLLTLFSVVALVLAAVGLYGVISYSVAQRTNEIGIRMALGAQASDVLRMVLRHGAVLGLVGIGLGVAIAVGLIRLLRQALFGLDTLDPLTCAGMVLLLALVTMVACFIPARRAARVDPLIALRYE